MWTTTSSPRLGILWCAGALAASSLSAQEPGVDWSTVDSATWAAILDAEDARVQNEVQLEALVQGTQSANPAVRLMAVRALGRLEHESQIVAIAPLMEDPVVAVAVEAVNALGQAVHWSDPSDVKRLLIARVPQEPVPQVWSVMLETVGRLKYTDRDDFRDAEAVLLAAVPGNSSEKLAIVRGLASLTRVRGIQMSLSGLVRLRELARFQDPNAPEEAVRVRRLATATLGAAGGMRARDHTDLSRDVDAEVRRQVFTAALGADSFPGIEQLLSEGLRDSDAGVRYAAVRLLGRRGGSTICERALAFIDDTDRHVALLAVDLLGTCAEHDPGLAALLHLVAEWGTAEGWHKGGHAMVALARAAPTLGDSVLRSLARPDSWEFRVYAARAAAEMGAVGSLTSLVEDESDNVRTAAVIGLSEVSGHRADPLFARQLGRSDYQLLMTAATALAGSPLRETQSRDALVTGLFSAFLRITVQRRETSRDVRLALLDRIGEFGDSTKTDLLELYLTDFDPVVAERVTVVLTSWTGRAYTADPQPLPRLQLPTFTEVQELARTRVVLVMAGGGEIELRLYPFEAPTNAARFVRLARGGYYDGLTFHRVVPGFVIQGGSPGANEFMGDGPFTRDELGLRSHARGTVGLSTRGRDTGDAQFFVNLVDNPRLDHDYTIFAEVVRGMDVVDAVLEGDVIERVEFRN